MRNRHSNIWYGRITIPIHLRIHFAGKREIRLSLATADIKEAKKHALQLWLRCQFGFDLLQDDPLATRSFTHTREFLAWIRYETCWMAKKKNIRDDLESLHHEGQSTRPEIIETTDIFGATHKIDLGDPLQEQAAALAMQNNAIALLEKYKDNPDILDRLLKVQQQDNEPTSMTEQPESPMRFSEAIDQYSEKLRVQGRKGKRLAERTLQNYIGTLKFWQEVFGDQFMHDVTLQELRAVQMWLTRLPLHYTKLGKTVLQAVEMAKDEKSDHQCITDKTRAEYLGQLKGLLQYAFDCGFITNDMAPRIEIPNTKQIKALQRLPYTTEELQAIFPGKDYGVDFGKTLTGVDPHSKFWFPLLGAFTGARLEELGQLTIHDVKTCPDTGIIYLAIKDTGVAADGKTKRTKNKNSVRPIPVHSTLLNIGFMDYHQYRKSDPTNKGLFPLNRDSTGRMAKGVSNWFSRVEKRKDRTILGYLEKRGIKSKGQDEDGVRFTKSFHSFRHSVVDNLRGKKLPSGEYIRESDVGLVVGHVSGKLETAFYGIDRTQLLLRRDVLERLDYPGVDFDAISWQAYCETLPAKDRPKPKKA